MTKIYDGYVMALMRVKVQVRNLELPEVPSVANMTEWLKKQEEFDMTEGFEPVTVETVDALEARPVAAPNDDDDDWGGCPCCDIVDVGDGND